MKGESMLCRRKDTSDQDQQHNLSSNGIHSAFLAGPFRKPQCDQKCIKNLTHCTAVVIRDMLSFPCCEVADRNLWNQPHRTVHEIANDTVSVICTACYTDSSGGDCLLCPLYCMSNVYFRVHTYCTYVPLTAVIYRNHHIRKGVRPPLAGGTVTLQPQRDALLDHDVSQYIVELER